MAARDFSRRSTAGERMDMEPLARAELRDCLRQLARVNVLSFGYRPTLAWLAEAVRRHGTAHRFSLLDVGFGYGDMLRRIRRWAAGRGIAIDLHGVDINPVTRDIALSVTPGTAAIRYHTADIFALPDEPRYDLIISSLFAHHLDDEALARFLRWMETQAAIGWFINDLHRSRLAHVVVTRFLDALGCHPVVRHDGGVSVERALTLAEWRRAVARAGLDPATVTMCRVFPFRVGIGRLS